MQDIMPFIENHLMLCLAWVIIFVFIIFTMLQQWFFNIKVISCEEVIKFLNKEKAVIIDLRNSDIYCKGHIINSLNLAVADIKSGNLSQLDKANKTKPVIIVCASGSTPTARNLAKKLTKAGFERIYFLKEGIYGWSRNNFPLIRDK
ncbi:rhodanese-like domain-containing protein [Candidatus Hoaglandella endobia]|uniref:Thiosulfate sulfurtransferase GlpE n=1 Tax=Candidatus Hoaglandella endobia TaxID=1778263 RepID=A0A143WTX7_9ENTR|nr:rhodanese-like domain-containing protein [Candidatus Hoaglandella endobia]CUX97148.1 Thiosulfate sulfurtransferase GlpE [Candidatus Hoaglandella endobia]